MLTSRNKPQWLLKAKQEVEELWEQHLELSDQVEMCGSREKAEVIDQEIARVGKEIERAETNYAKLYHVWDNYCGLKVKLSNHDPIVASIDYPIETVQEMVCQGK